MQNAVPLTRPVAGLSLAQWLRVDALTCVLTGLLLTAGSNRLSTLLGLPPNLLFYAGAVLFPCAALMLLASRTRSAPLVWLVVMGNFAWAAASVAVVFAMEPTSIGVVVTLAQAAAVALLGVLEWRAR